MILGMNTVPECAYLAAEGLSRPIPLERFLPNCPVGVVKQLLDDLPEDKWVLDPFGSNPLLDIEAATSGHRVLVTANNPILAFLLMILAEPRSKESYLAALADMASQLRGSERLETHIRNLYTTRCVICHNEVQADGYLWQRGMNRPHVRLYRCQVCGEEGEHPLSEEDLQLLEPIQRGEKLPYARAIARVLGGSQEDRPAVEEALKLYNSRSLYVLFTLLNKIDGMDVSVEKHHLLEAMLIVALEAGTSLWPWPNSGEPPRQLTVPSVYLEKNLWKELERSIDLLAQPVTGVELTFWPVLPKGPGICLFRGPIRAMELHPSFEIGRILALPPRPNQALWTLSALWSAWLWGRESETRFSQVLGRRRFDWHWHTLALHQALQRTREIAGDKAPMNLLIGEPSPGMSLATVTAAGCAGFHPDGIAMRDSREPIEINWSPVGDMDKGKVGNIQSIARTAIQNRLEQTGEPADYLSLYTAVIAALEVNDGLPREISQFTQDKSSEIQGIIARLFADRDFLRRFDDTSQELDSGKWGLVNASPGMETMADRLEREVLSIFQSSKSVSGSDIQRQINQKFKGWLTPSPTLIEFCLRAYSDWDPQSGLWTLRAGEAPDIREREIDEIARLLRSIATKLSANVSGSTPMVWKISDGQSYHLWVSTTACISQYCTEPEETVENVFILPGSRAELLKYKMTRDPQLRERVSNGWHFLKFRALRSLAARADLTPEIWQMLLDSDPITLEESLQLRMFG
jgi:hypothetical protein